MNTLTYIDPMYSSKASISFGQFMLSVNIEGLETANFIHNTLPDLVPHASSQAIATVLSMNTTEQWMIDLNFEQTISRMADAFRMKDFPALADLVDSFQDSPPVMTLRAYWSKVIKPCILSNALHLGIDTQTDTFNAVMTWAHPGNSSRKLHPRAIRFLSHAFPEMLGKYQASKQTKMSKSA